MPFRIGRHTTLFRARKKKEIDRLSRKNYQRSTFAVHTMPNSAERKKRKRRFFFFFLGNMGREDGCFLQCGGGEDGKGSH